jgi:hypothetical protein
MHGAQGSEDDSRSEDGSGEIGILLGFDIGEFPAKHPDGLLEFSKIKPHALALGADIQLDVPDGAVHHLSPAMWAGQARVPSGILDNHSLDLSIAGNLCDFTLVIPSSAALGTYVKLKLAFRTLNGLQQRVHSIARASKRFCHIFQMVIQMDKSSHRAFSAQAIVRIFPALKDL